MARLSAAELKKLLHIACTSHTLRDLEDLKAGILEPLKELVPQEASGIVTFDSFTARPKDIINLGFPQRVVEEYIKVWLPRDPGVPILVERKGPVCIKEFPPEWFNSSYYREFLMPNRLTDGISSLLFNEQGVPLGILFILSDGKILKERHKTILELLMPTISGTLRRLELLKTENLEGLLKNLKELINSAKETRLVSAENPSLTPRERAVLQLLLDGKTNKEIACHLNISPETVNTHLDHIYGKMGVTTRLEAASFALTGKRVLGLDKKPFDL